MGRSKKKILKKRRTKKQKGGNQQNKLLVNLMGGLGNRFFQIMAGLGFAEKWNMELFLKEGSYNHVSEDVSKKDILQLFPTLKYFDKSNNNSSYVSINEDTKENPNTNAVQNGYFGSEEYFPKHHPKIHLAEPKDNIIKNIDKNKLFFIHLRLGDFKNIKGYQLPPNYYKKSIKEIKNIVNDAIFIIISNEQSGAKEFVQKELLNTLANSTILYDNDKNENRLDSIYYMSQCKGGVMANSTFSWFGAYCIPHKDKKLLFAPKPWFKDDTGLKIYPSWASFIQNGGNKLN